MKTIETRVQSGMQKLDERLPGWPQKIDLERLDMCSNTDGILEQLFGGYYAGLKALGLRFAGGWDHGFDIEPDSDGDLEAWAQLTEAWKTAIQRKRAKEVPGTK